MKKTIKALFAIAIAVLALVSCGKDNSTPSTSDQLVEVTLIAGNPEALAATRTEMEGSTPKWSVSDSIGVSDGTSSNVSFKTSILSASTTATFTGTTVTGTYYAYYPFTKNGVSSYGAKVDLPAIQNPTVNSFDGSADIMVAKSFTVSGASTVENLQFARLGAIVKIVLTDTESTMATTQHPTSVSMTAASNLVGRVYVNMVNQELGDIYYNGSKTVTANYTAGTKYAIDGTNATYLIVYPQTLDAGSTLTISASTEDYAIEKVITVPAGGIELLPGKINTLNISLLSSHITPDTGDALPFNDNMAWANNGASDSSTDISSTISSAANSNGLYTTGSKAYKGIGGLKLGTSSASGSITTKQLNLSGAFNIAIKGAYYDADANLVVSVDGTEVLNEAFSSINYVNIAAGTYTSKSKVTIATSAKRGRIYSVKIRSGAYVPYPEINVTSSNPMAVDNTNDLHAVEYTISNPGAGSISASSNVAWIHDFDYSVDGEVAFEVDAQETDASARSGIITLSYSGADDVKVTVNQAAGPSSGNSYTITFSTGSGNGTDASTSTACSTIVSAGASYLSGNLVTATKAAYSGDYGLKLGTSSAAGVIKMNLASSVTPTSIVVRAKRYNASKAATVSLNGEDAQDVTDSFDDYTFDITSSTSYLQINSSKYIWVQSITVNY